MVSFQSRFFWYPPGQFLNLMRRNGKVPVWTVLEIPVPLWFPDIQDGIYVPYYGNDQFEKRNGYEFDPHYLDIAPTYRLEIGNKRTDELWFMALQYPAGFMCFRELRFVSAERIAPIRHHGMIGNTTGTGHEEYAPLYSQFGRRNPNDFHNISLKSDEINGDTNPGYASLPQQDYEESLIHNMYNTNIFLPEYKMPTNQESDPQGMYGNKLVPFEMPAYIKEKIIK